MFLPDPSLSGFRMPSYALIVMVCLSQVEGYDMKLVGPETWSLLQRWYGGGPGFPRAVVMRGYQESVELYPQPCNVRTCLSNGAPSATVEMLLASRSMKAADLLQLCCSKLGVSASVSRLWTKVWRARVWCRSSLSTACWGRRTAVPPPPPYSRIVLLCAHARAAR